MGRNPDVQADRLGLVPERLTEIRVPPAGMMRLRKEMGMATNNSFPQGHFEETQLGEDETRQEVQRRAPGESVMRREILRTVA
jgi:hypothetical protein